MKPATMIRTDQEIQAAVQDELDWTPDVDNAGIGVAVEDGTVSLSGEVDTYAEYLAAKRAALRVRGVRAVVDQLVVHPRSDWPVSETDIAKEVDHALRWAANVPATVKAEVKEHMITLRGAVDWDYQRVAAERAVAYLRGVHSVVNLVTLTTRPSAKDTEARVRSALRRNAQLDANTIDAEVTGSKVRLSGVVQSWAERTQAERAAWASPYVSEVDNDIVVRAL